MNNEINDEGRLDPYEHAHAYVEEIPWSRLGQMLIELIEDINQAFRPEVVVGIAKGGVIPAVFASSAFGVDFFPIKLSSRHNEKIISKTPRWHVYPTEAVRGKRVLLIDDISVAGRTIGLACEELSKCGAVEIRTATLAVHHGGTKPDFFCMDTDALIVWPWDRDMIRKDGSWFINHEYEAEMDRIEGYNPSNAPAREPMGRWQ